MSVKPFGSDTPFGTSPFGRVPPRHVWVYAGFWFRVLAWWVDTMVVCVLGWAVSLAVAPSLSITILDSGTGGGLGGGKYQIADIVPADYSYSYNMLQPTWHGSGLYEALQFVLPALYFILFESSRLQATPGKLLCRMRVTDVQGARIGVRRAAGRYFGKFLSLLLCGFGFLMVMWTSRKQGLHDLLAGTCVIRRQEEALLTFTPPG
ncbi:hypothetical protein AA13595_0536 [Gluconacetobacter johannae DSM 13595]|uniref:RDD family protein n=1 Tax=Gluconacetobacter johannae TaxID=112140 RepID=A0A7W4P4T1_9PROT|nr:RDD family protein [Gluconacetobacter johannae]MBB2177357.1 RDD family protein [Gluconacetobacter johannae]GBQ81161.1 hypothetical protein AA13595_0536 [Gluconacetobacter johannae DSM 13595]